MAIYCGFQPITTVLSWHLNINTKWCFILVSECHCRYYKYFNITKSITSQANFTSTSQDITQHLRTTSSLYLVRLGSVICSLSRCLSEDDCWRWLWVALSQRLPVMLVWRFCGQLLDNVIKQEKKDFNILLL